MTSIESNNAKMDEENCPGPSSECEPRTPVNSSQESGIQSQITPTSNTTSNSSTLSATTTPNSPVTPTPPKANGGKAKKLPLLKLDSSSDSQMTRRSSSRSIKRKKFDDELVESSITYSKAQRTRTLSASTPVVSGKTIGAQTITSPSTVTPTTPTVIEPAVSTVSKQIRAKPVASTSRKRTHRKAHLNALKDLSRWKPTDDLALVLAVQQTNDLDAVYRGVKFSCKFTLQEIEDRWYALLYDPTIAKIGVAAIRQLHADVISQVHARALYSEAEENILKTVPASSQPTIEVFQDLLTKYPHVFLPYRNAKSLLNHWSLMKHYHLLPDQTIQPLPRHEEATNFADTEELVDKEIQHELQAHGASALKEDPLSQEFALADRRVKREIRQLENEIPKWQVLVDSITGVAPSDFDNQTLAVLRGRLVRYLMRSREITLGRCTKESTVDVDLALEGPASKISRKQGIIKLQPNGEFMIANTGKRPFHVDSKPVLGGGNCAKVNNNSVVEIAGLRFVFLINQDLIAHVRAEALKNQM